MLQHHHENTLPTAYHATCLHSTTYHKYTHTTSHLQPRHITTPHPKNDTFNITIVIITISPHPQLYYIINTTTIIITTATPPHQHHHHSHLITPAPLSPQYSHTTSPPRHIHSYTTPLHHTTHTHSGKHHHHSTKKCKIIIQCYSNTLLMKTIKQKD